MDSLTKKVAKITSSVLFVSTSSTLNRYKNEKLRRTGLKGNSLFKYDSKNVIEYNVSVNKNSDILVIFENGLGDPLEVWDYIKIFLKDEYNLFFYNRPGYGMSKSTMPTYEIIQKIIDENLFQPSRIVFVAHSIGALSTCSNLEKFDPLKKKIEKIILIDGTEPELFEKYRVDSNQRGEFLQASAQKAFAGLFGFQWWGIDRYARRTSYQPDIQEAVRLFNANPKEILASVREYKSIDVEPFKKIISSKNNLLHIISSSERRYQQQQLSQKYSIPICSVDGSLHHSVIGSPVFARKVAVLIRKIIEE